jgi:predicted nucleotidyltransferase
VKGVWAVDHQVIEQARAYHRQRELADRAGREALRRQQVQAVRLAVQNLVPHYPAVQAVYLFGSLVRPGAFGPDSDIDLAVVCDDLAEESRFWQALEAVLTRPVDLRPYRAAVAWAVDTYGECLYERKVSTTGSGD